MARWLQTAGLAAVLCAGCGTTSTPVPANTEKGSAADPETPSRCRRAAERHYSLDGAVDGIRKLWTSLAS